MTTDVAENYSAATAVDSIERVMLSKGHEISRPRLVEWFGNAEPDETALKRVIQYELGYSKFSKHQLEPRELILAEKAGQLPCLIHLKNNEFAVIEALVWQNTPDGLGCSGVSIYLPNDQTCEQTLDWKQLDERWDGTAYFYSRSDNILNPNQSFSLKWFIPKFLRYRGEIAQLVLAYVFIVAIGLAVPFYFQNVIDTVLSNNAKNTLIALTIGVSLAILFETIFNYLNQYFLLRMTSQIDIGVAVQTFKKLLNLPIQLFDQMPAGITAQHMEQSSEIRGFLSGSLFFTVLQLPAAFIFGIFLGLISWQLLIVVIICSLAIFFFILIVLPRYQRQLHELYIAAGNRKAFLISTIKGMHTVKGLALNDLKQKEWEQRSSDYTLSAYNVQLTTMLISAVGQFFEKIATIGIVFFGSFLVFNESLTVGSLVAFNMLAGRVIGPLAQVAALIHEYKEAKLSAEKLGILMNHTNEWGRKETGTAMPTNYEYAVELKNISYAYPDTKENALSINNVIKIKQGSTVGIVGKSGSGKTTLSRILLGFFKPSTGSISICGIDTKDINLIEWRKRVGVVLQDSYLFEGTIRDNIKVQKPDAIDEEVIKAATDAKIWDFINEQTEDGLNSYLLEDGQNLSGGQRQRIAIARILINKPDIIIFDEATSALDPETESDVKKTIENIAYDNTDSNLNGITKPTILIITHRLSTLKKSDTKIVLNNGMIEKLGTHQELMDSSTGSKTYRTLWESQKFD